MYQIKLQSYTTNPTKCFKSASKVFPIFQIGIIGVGAFLSPMGQDFNNQIIHNKSQKNSEVIPELLRRASKSIQKNFQTMNFRSDFEAIRGISGVSFLHKHVIGALDSLSSLYLNEIDRSVFWNNSQISQG